MIIKSFFLHIFYCFFPPTSTVYCSVICKGRKLLNTNFIYNKKLSIHTFLSHLTLLEVVKNVFKILLCGFLAFFVLTLTTYYSIICKSKKVFNTNFPIYGQNDICTYFLITPEPFGSGKKLWLKILIWLAIFYCLFLSHL